MPDIAIAAIVVAATSVAVVLPGRQHDRARVIEDSANPHAIQQP